MAPNGHVPASARASARSTRTRHGARAREAVSARLLQQYQSCWKCLLRCFCISPKSVSSASLQFDSAQAQQDAIVSTLARLSVETVQSAPSLSAYRRGLNVLSNQTSEDDLYAWPDVEQGAAGEAAAPNVVRQELQPPEGLPQLPATMLLDLAVAAAHFARLSLAAYNKGLYGVVMPTRAFFTRACCLISRSAAFEELSGVAQEDILEAALVAEAFQPVYWVLRDRKTGCLVVTIRGTFSMSDIISDVYASQTEYRNHVIHEGTLHSARWIYEKVLPLLRRESGDGRRVILTGHSLGGAVAAVLAWLLREDAQLDTLGFVFGVPQVVDESLATKMQRYVVGIIHGYDMVPQLSTKSLQDFQQQIADAAKTPEERLASLEDVLQEFALPVSPRQLHQALLRQENVLPRLHSPQASEYEDAIGDVGQLPPIVMGNPGYQLHLRRRALNRRWDRMPIIWKRSMKHFLIAVSSARAQRRIQPAWTMWQDHWPQSYLYCLEALAERLADGGAETEDEWEDQLEYAIAFHLIGAHRLENYLMKSEPLCRAEARARTVDVRCSRRLLFGSPEDQVHQLFLELLKVNMMFSNANGSLRCGNDKEMLAFSMLNMSKRVLCHRPISHSKSMPDDVLAWNALGTTVENLKSNLEHWIREERLRALERQTDAEVASTQGSWEQRLSSLLREVQSVQKDFAEVKDLLRSADSDLAEELLPKEEDLVSLVTKFLEQMASKKEKSKSESEEEKEEKKGKGKKDKDQKKNKGEKEEEKEEKVEKDQSKGPRKGSAKKHRKKRRRSKKDRDDLSGSYSYSRSPSPRKRRRHRRHRRHRRRCSESSYDSASRKGRRKHRKGRRKERRKGSEGIDVDAEIDRFVKVNKLEERCEKILRDLESSVALKVMGLSPGSSHTFELSGDVRDPTAVVLARVRKAQFAKEIRPGARRRRRRSSSRS
ncbi:unnamed protein product [Durusdinium trenchii]|uniref:sn-1-specific diacylglycerol lipase n=1 Tax=Durusdinium trenchii TaxID=1381693 RepID=A0ABP0JLC4_9DINO